MAHIWTNTPKASGTPWTNVPKPTNSTTSSGTPIGLLLALTIGTTVTTSNWTNVSKASGTVWTNVAKAT